MYVYDMCVRYPLGQETVLSGTRVVVSGHVGGFWELNPGPLQEQQLCFTPVLPLQPCTNHAKAGSANEPQAMKMVMVFLNSNVHACLKLSPKVEEVSRKQQSMDLEVSELSPADEKDEPAR